jgi:class 3 adenylate cyclase
MANKPTPRPKNPKQSAKTKRASQEAAANTARKANSEKLKLALRQRAGSPRGPIISGSLGGGGGLNKANR